MRHRGRTVGLHEAANLQRARDAFRAARGLVGDAARQADIDALPAVEWKGRVLRLVTCEGPFGNGPHVMNVPESLLWSLIDVQHFLCAHHR